MTLQKITNIHAFGDDIKNGAIKINKNKLAQKIWKLKINTKPRNPKMMKEKSDFQDNAMAFLKGREIVYYGVERGIFPLPNKSIVLVEAEKSNYQSTQSH